MFQRCDMTPARPCPTSLTECCAFIFSTSATAIIIGGKVFANMRSSASIVNVDRTRQGRRARPGSTAAMTPLLNPKPTTEVEATSILSLLEREDCTPMACYRFLYAPRTGGAYDSHHRTAGIADRTRRRGGHVAARGAGLLRAGRIGVS